MCVGPPRCRGVGKQSDLTMYGLTKLYAILSMRVTLPSLLPHSALAWTLVHMPLVPIPFPQLRSLDMFVSSSFWISLLLFCWEFTAWITLNSAGPGQSVFVSL